MGALTLRLGHRPCLLHFDPVVNAVFTQSPWGLVGSDDLSGIGPQEEIC